MNSSLVSRADQIQLVGCSSAPQRGKSVAAAVGARIYACCGRAHTRAPCRRRMLPAGQLCETQKQQLRQ